MKKGRGGENPIEFLCRKFYEAVPAGRRKKLKLLDINSEKELKAPFSETLDDSQLLPAVFCNRLLFLERSYKGLPTEERKQKRLEKEPEIWDEFWSWLGTLNPTGGSKLEKAVNFNHKDTLMNYLLDGRREISNC